MMMGDTNATNNISSTTTATTNSNNNNRLKNNNNKRILIVDDEPDVVSVFKMILEMSGFEVDAYDNALSALDNFKPNSYGLLLLDIRMTAMNGFELYKKIRKVDDKVKACFITAFDDYYYEEFKESFPELDEAKYFIRKPKAVEDLVNHVATILG
jgi:two-component system, OmpR family, response regulator ChvI